VQRSAPIDLGVSRTDIRDGMAAVYRHGDRAPGIDWRTFRQTFGKGPDSTRYQRTHNRLVAERRRAKLGAAKYKTLCDRFTGKDREVSLPTYDDRILLRAQTEAISRVVPTTKINCCRSGLDSRWSVVRAATELRLYRLLAQKIDIEKAFDSVQYQALLDAKHVRELLPATLREGLKGVLEWYVPNGNGIPTGLSISPLLLDLACRRFDQRIGDMKVLAFRYLDDILVLAQDEIAADRVIEIATEELAPFGLRPHPQKTRMYCCNADRFSWDELRVQPRREEAFPWLGHEIDMTGKIDVAEGPAARLVAMANDRKQVEQWINHFELASKGDRYRSTLELINHPLSDQQETDPVAMLLAFPARKYPRCRRPRPSIWDQQGRGR
jgi:hypothetical protein